MIWLISILGMVLRFWKIGFGLPHVIFGDEGLYVYFALNMGGGFLDPKFYPDLYFYLCFLADGVYILFSWFLGRFHSPGEAWSLYRIDPTVFYIIARSVSAVLGTLTIPVTYKIGKKIFGSSQVGYLAALFLSLSYMHVQYSQIAFLDVTLTFFVILAFFFGLLALESGKLLDFCLSGLTGGLAFSVKYNGLGVIMWGPLICLLHSLRDKTPVCRGLVSRSHLFFLLFFLLGFTLGTPYWIGNWQGFSADIADRVSLYGKGVGHLGWDGDWNSFHYLLVVLPNGLGWPLTIGGVAGILLLLSRLKPKNVFFVSFPILYFLVTGFSPVRAARYMMPIIPFVCVSAAYLVFSVGSWFQENRRLYRVILSAMTCLMIAQPVLLLSRYFFLKTFPDTRQMAYDWLKTNLGSHKRVLETYAGISFVPPGESFGLADLDYDVFDVRKRNISSLRSLEEYKKEGYEYLLLDEWHLGVVMNAPQTNKRLREKYRKNRDRYQAFLLDLEKSALLLSEFSPYINRNVPFDPEDVQFASRSLWNRKHLGPTIRIYKLQ